MQLIVLRQKNSTDQGRDGQDTCAQLHAYADIGLVPVVHGHVASLAKQYNNYLVASRAQSSGDDISTSKAGYVNRHLFV